MVTSTGECVAVYEIRDPPNVGVAGGIEGELEPQDEFDDQDEDAEEARDGDGNSKGLLLGARRRRGRVQGQCVYQPTPIIKIAKRPPHFRALGSYLVNRHEATDLINATLLFL